MKVILYMAMTVNGMIARENDETPWSDAEWKAYHSFVKRTGNLIVGRRTCEIMKQDGTFGKLGSPTTVVVSKSTPKRKESSFIFVTSPREAVSVLKEKGFKEAAVGGGSKLNAAFLKAGLIDEVWLDVEPLFFGKGIPLFAGIDAEAKLKLLEVKNLSSNTLRIRYKVLK